MDEKALQMVTQEIGKLWYRLNFASHAYQGNKEADRRPAVRVAVYAFSDFIGTVFATHPELRIPMTDLLHGLDDLDRGRAVPLLARAERKAPLDLSTTLFRAHAAALMRLYQDAGMERASAAQQAASSLNRLGYRNGKARISVKDMKAWLNEINAGKRELAKMRFDSLKAHLAQAFPGEPEKAAKFLLDMLPGMIAPQIPNMSRRN